MWESPAPSFKGLVSFSLERLCQSTVPFFSSWRNFHTICHLVLLSFYWSFIYFFHMWVCVHACVHTHVPEDTLWSSEDTLQRSVLYFQMEDWDWIQVKSVAASTFTHWVTVAGTKPPSTESYRRGQNEATLSFSCYRGALSPYNFCKFLSICFLKQMSSSVGCVESARQQGCGWERTAAHQSGCCLHN